MPSTAIATALTRDMTLQRIWEQYSDVPSLAQLYNTFPLPKNPNAFDSLNRDIKVKRWLQYLTAKVARPYVFGVNMTFAGVAGQTITLNTQGVNGRLIVLKGTTNATPANFNVSVRETSGQRNLQSAPVPPTSLFSSTDNTTEKYFTFPTPLVLENNATIEVTCIDTVGTATTVFFIFWAIWCPDEMFFGGNANDKLLDEFVLRSMMEEDSYKQAKTFILNMRVPFTTTAGERVTALTQQQEKPLLILGMQQDIVTKNAAFLLGGLTSRFTMTANNYGWSNAELPLWAFANFITEPEQYLPFSFPYFLPPGTQISGAFTNMTGGNQVAAGDVQFICATP